MNSAEHSSIEYQMGVQSGQMTALITQVTSLSAQISSLETRLRINESKTTQLNTKFTVVGLVAGSVGSFLMTLLLKFLKF